MPERRLEAVVSRGVSHADRFYGGSMWQSIFIVVVTATVTMALSILKRNLGSGERKLDYRLQELALDDPTFERCMAHLLGPPLVDGNRITSLLNGD